MRPETKGRRVQNTHHSWTHGTDNVVKMVTTSQTTLLKRFFFNETVRILIKISPDFVPTDTINIIPVLVHIMAWRRPGDKPLSRPMMVGLLTHVCATWPQWVKRARWKFPVIQMSSSVYWANITSDDNLEAIFILRWPPGYHQKWSSIGIPMLKIRRSRDHLIFKMEIPYLGKTVFILKRGPGSLHSLGIIIEASSYIHIHHWNGSIHQSQTNAYELLIGLSGVKHKFVKTLHLNIQLRKWQPFSQASRC